MKIEDQACSLELSRKLNEKINEIIDHLNGEGEEKPHEHKHVSCDKGFHDNMTNGCERDSISMCCLCNKHEGCELNKPHDKTYLHCQHGLTEPPFECTQCFTSEGINLYRERIGYKFPTAKPAEPAGWEVGLRMHREKILWKEHQRIKGLEFREMYDADFVEAFIRQVEREAKLAGFDEAYVITAKSNNSEEAYNRIQKKRAELERNA